MNRDPLRLLLVPKLLRYLLKLLPDTLRLTLLPVPQDPGANCYSQQDLDRIIQTFLHASKGRSEDQFKAKTLDIYHGRSDMECYNFCQQCEDHFATCRATGPNQIPFAASFLRDRINFCWQWHKWKLEAESSVPIS